MITVATLGSHSALDICRGAKDEGFRTLVVAQKGREKTYNSVYKTRGGFGCVDECIVLPHFKDILRPAVQKRLLEQQAIFIPHRSFEAYLNFDYEAIERDFRVSIFGNRFLLKIEERGVHPNQYDILSEAGIHFPCQFSDPKDIDRLCIVKVLESARGFERAFFLVKNYTEYKNQVRKKLSGQLFTQAQLNGAVIEEFVVGVPVNFNFFYSTISKRLELMGTDTRRQTNVEGIGKLPALYQNEVLARVPLKFEEAGHIAVTVLESLLEDAFTMGEHFVEATKKLFPPGIIGPFSLQTIITPGPPKKDIIVIDVSPRMPGSPGIGATPYSGYLYGKPISMGRRVAMEIHEALRDNERKKIVT